MREIGERKYKVDKNVEGSCKQRKGRVPGALT